MPRIPTPQRKVKDRDRPYSAAWRQAVHEEALAFIARVKARDEAARKRRAEAKAQTSEDMHSEVARLPPWCVS